MSLSPDEVKSIIDIVNEQSALSSTDHSHHHAFIEAMIQKEERKQETWQKVKVQVLGWGVIAISGFIGTWVYNHLK